MYEALLLRLWPRSLVAFFVVPEEIPCFLGDVAGDNFRCFGDPSPNPGPVVVKSIVRLFFASYDHTTIFLLFPLALTVDPDERCTMLQG